jgi:hypothetical protein
VEVKDAVLTVIAGFGAAFKSNAPQVLVCGEWRSVVPVDSATFIGASPGSILVGPWPERKV